MKTCVSGSVHFLRLALHSEFSENKETLYFRLESPYDEIQDMVVAESDRDRCSGSVHIGRCRANAVIPDSGALSAEKGGRHSPSREGSPIRLPESGRAARAPVHRSHERGSTGGLRHEKA